MNNRVFGDNQLTDVAPCETAEREITEECICQSVRERWRRWWRYVLSSAHRTIKNDKKTFGPRERPLALFATLDDHRSTFFG